MLSTRSSRPPRGLRGGVDIVAEPLWPTGDRRGGSVNTLDRSLRSGEPVLPLPLLRRRQAPRAPGRRAARAVHLADRARADVATLSAAWPALMVAAHRHRPHILFLDEPRPASTAEPPASGRSSTAFTARVSPCCSRRTIWKRQTTLRPGGDHGHGRILALDTPRGLKARSVPTRSPVPRPATRLRLPPRSRPPRRRRPHRDRRRCGHRVPQGADGVVPRIVALADAAALPSRSVGREPTLETVFITLTARSCANERRRRPSRDAPAMAFAHRARVARASGLCCCATCAFCARRSSCLPSAPSCSRCCWCSCSPTSFPRSAGVGVRRRRSASRPLMAVGGDVDDLSGVQAVALPLVQEFGYTREIEDRSWRPCRCGGGVEKIARAVQALIAGLVVFRWRPSFRRRRCTCTCTGCSC